jgi:hypothetical protein
LIALSLSEAVVHVYKYETFDSISDAKVFKGGHEGMFRTRDYAEGSVVTPKRQGTSTLLPVVSADSSQLQANIMFTHTAAILSRALSPRGAGLVPDFAGTNDGKSFIKMGDLFFKRSKHEAEKYAEDEGFTGLVEVIVFERSQQDMIGYATDVRYCLVLCVPDLIPMRCYGFCNSLLGVQMRVQTCQSRQNMGYLGYLPS